jgi:hypothetical protein
MSQQGGGMGRSQTTQLVRSDVLELGASTAVDSTIGRSCDFIPRRHPKSRIGEPVIADGVKSFDRILRFAHTAPYENLTLNR